MAPAATIVVGEGVERLCRAFTERIAARGFTRTRKMFWTRADPRGVDAIHLHRGGISYGAPINFAVSLRVHLGRWPVGTKEGPLNGPSSTPDVTRAGRYHLRFNANSGSTYERCLDDLVRTVADVGEPWFTEAR